MVRAAGCASDSRSPAERELWAHPWHSAHDELRARFNQSLSSAWIDDFEVRSVGSGTLLGLWLAVSHQENRGQHKYSDKEAEEPPGSSLSGLARLPADRERVRAPAQAMLPAGPAAVAAPITAATRHGAGEEADHRRRRAFEPVRAAFRTAACRHAAPLARSKDRRLALPAIDEDLYHDERGDRNEQPALGRQL